MTTAAHPAWHRSMIARVALASTAVLVVVFVLLLITPVTVSAPIRLTEALVLAAGLAAGLAINLVLIRRALAPLSSLASQMQGIELREPTPLRLDREDAPELSAFVGAFNSMLERLAEERRLSARAALTAQERERLRVGRALHDEAGQSLTAIALEIERLARQARPEERQQLDVLAGQLHESLDDIRRISRQLRPEALDDLGLVNALIALSTRVSRQGGIPVERDFGTELPDLPEELELVIYRVAQEALTNVLRHAHAERCSIGLRSANGTVELAIVDDGRGMPDEAGSEAVGIEGMRERALLAGGTLTIGPGGGGRGTEVRLTAPVEGA
jgi:two-component system sensor histidine kinase UhpB